MLRVKVIKIVCYSMEELESKINEILSMNKPTNNIQVLDKNDSHYWLILSTNSSNEEYLEDYYYNSIKE